MQSVEATTSDRGTRDRVSHAVLTRGPVTAAQLAADLGVTAAAVRRHLDALVAGGLIQAREESHSAPRGRGRPARRFVASAAGHAAAPSAYDDLAAAALRSLEREGGRDAVRRFARARADELEVRYRARVDAAGPQVAQRAGALAGALSADGYAASSGPAPRRSVSPSTASPAGTAPGEASVQLCQGHCPVHAVAAQFPELCHAEARAFSRLLGVPVQRLATIASGSHACTTHVSAPATERSTARATARALTTAPPTGTDPHHDR